MQAYLKAATGAMASAAIANVGSNPTVPTHKVLNALELHMTKAETAKFAAIMAVTGGAYYPLHVLHRKIIKRRINR